MNHLSQEQFHQIMEVVHSITHRQGEKLINRYGFHFNLEQHTEETIAKLKKALQEITDLND